MTKLQPGHVGVPTDYPDFMLYYSYTYVKDSRNTYGNIPVAAYNIKDGVLNFVATNHNVTVIKERDKFPPS